MIVSLLLMLCLSPMWEKVSTAPVGKDCKITQTDVIFVLDASSSIAAQDFKEMMKFVLKFVDDIPEMGKTGTQVGIYTFATSFKNEIQLGKYQDKASLKKAIMSISASGGSTQTYLVLEDVLDNGFSVKDARPNAQRAVVVITDGESTSIEKTKRAAEKLHAAKIFAFAIGVGKKISKEELRNIATSDEDVSYVQNFQGLKTVEKVNRVICKQKIPPVHKVCTKRENTDIIFVLDSSGNIKDQEFIEMLQFVSKFVEDTPVIGKKGTQIGIYLFSTGFRYEIQLGKYQDKASLKKAIMGLPRRNGGTQTDLVLDDVLTNGFDARADARPNAKRAVVVITDGKSEDAEKTRTAAVRLHQANFITFGIGVGSAINKGELRTIASREENVGCIKNPQVLERINSGLCDQTHTVCSIKPVDVVFVVDSSDSIKEDDFKKEIDFVRSFVDASEIGPTHIQVSLFTFADDSHFLIKLNDFKDKNALSLKLRGIQQEPGFTNTDKALVDVRTNAFAPENGGRGPGVKKVVIVLTDGSSMHPKATKAAADALHSLNIEMYAIGIGKQVDVKELHNIASRPHNVHTVPDFDGLKDIEKEITTKICVTDPTLPTQTPISVCSIKPVDVVFVVDSSDSIKKDDFKKEIDFVRSFVDASEIGPTHIQVSLFTFADDSHFLIKLNDFKDKNALSLKLRGIQQVPGFTNTDKALVDVRTNAFAPENGGRGPGVKKVVIVLTDGSSMHPKATKAAADALHSLNIKMYAIGIGKQVDVKELHNIASRPHNVHTVPDFDGLKDIEKEITTKVCVTDPTLPTQTPISVCSIKPVDVVFVVDSSDSIKKDDFKKEIGFVESFVATSEIGPSHIQVSLFLFSDDSHFLIKLNDFKDKNALLLKLRGIQQEPGYTNTDKALVDVRTNAFAPENGGRGPGVKKVVIVLTDGSSSDQEATKAAADALHSLNVEMFAIGIGKKVDVKELHNIASSPNNVHTVPDFGGLINIKKEITTKVCVTDPTLPTQTPIIVCSIKPVDVVFVVDSSDSIKKDDFKKEVGFVESFVAASEIGPTHIQVSLIIFSDESHFLIKLNDFKDKNALSLKLRGIRQEPGFTNTDKALVDVRTNAFAPENGGRGPGVKKVVIVLTDGSSMHQKATKAAADALHSLNIEMFAIGIGKQVDVKELHNIASSLNNVHTVPDFDGLINIEKEITTKVCVTDPTLPTQTPIIECKREPSDVIFLLDSSDSIKDIDFLKYVRFLTNFATNATIGPQNIQVGLFLFANNPSLLIRLNELNDRAKLVQRIQNMKRIHGLTYTGKALLDVSTRGFGLQNGGRASNVHQVLIVITDGESVIPSATQSAAYALRAMNVEIYAIGVGKINKVELRGISSSDDHMFTVPDFNSLSSIENNLFKKVCTQSTPSNGITSSNGVTSPNWGVPSSDGVTSPNRGVTSSNGITSSNRGVTSSNRGVTSSNRGVTSTNGGGIPNTTPRTNQCAKNKMADVLFLLDTSDSVTDDMLKKVETTVQKFIVSHSTGPQSVKVSVVTFGTRTTEVFNFKQSAASIKRSPGSTNTGEALKVAKSKSFQTSRGARAISHKVVIVITDGASDDLFETVKAADALRKYGVNIFAIGIGAADLGELTRITVKPSHVFLAMDSVDSITDQLFTGGCGPVKP